jgi:hypothetical protein
MLGYLTGFQIDTPRICFKRFDFSAIIPNNIEKENWVNNNFWVYFFVEKQDTSHETQHAARVVRTLLWVDNERGFDNSFVASVETHSVKYNMITRMHIKYVLPSTLGFRIILSYWG